MDTPDTPDPSHTRHPAGRHGHQRLVHWQALDTMFPEQPHLWNAADKMLAARHTPDPSARAQHLQDAIEHLRHELDVQREMAEPAPSSPFDPLTNTTNTSSPSSPSNVRPLNARPTRSQD